MKRKIFIPVATVLCVLLVALDQWTKQLAVTYLCNQDPIEIIPGVFELQYLRNAGAAFGIFQNKQGLFIAVTILAMMAFFYIAVFMPDEKRFLPLRFLVVLVMAGAVGNLIDRVTQSFVTDFFYFKLIDFPIFNVADCYVCVAVGLFLILFLFVYKDADLDEIIDELKRGWKR